MLAQRADGIAQGLHGGHEGSLGGQRFVVGLCAHLRQPQVVALLARLANDRKALRASAAYLQNAGLFGIDVVDAREHTFALEVHPLAPGFPALAQADHAKRSALAQATADQVEIARLENLQRQHRAWEENALQREKRQLEGRRFGRGLYFCHRSRASCSRWRTRVAARAAKRAASCSAA